MKNIKYRGKRPSPSISATSVNVGTAMHGGDGKMWICKSYARNGKRIKHWVRKWYKMPQYKYQIVIGGRVVSTGYVNGAHHASAAKAARKKIKVIIKDKDEYVSSHKLS